MMTVAAIATIFSLATGIITLFWRLSRVCFQVEHNEKIISYLQTVLLESINSKETVLELKKRSEENEAIVRTLENRLTSIEGKIDMLLNNKTR